MTNHTDVTQKRAVFAELHKSGCFVIPNPWNVGTARCLEDQGFKAIASTSSGHAYANGRPDGVQELDTVLAHLRELAAAVNIPLNADFENGFADDPEVMHENIVRCIETGVAGFSIEDAPQGGQDGLYSFKDAVARIKVARLAIDRSGEQVTLTARTEGFIRGAPDIDETIRRLKAFADAGADCLYSPGIKTRAHIEATVRAVGDRAINFLSGSSPSFSVGELERMGVRRISVGGALARVAMDAFLRVSQQIANNGVFDGFAGVVTNAEMNRRFERYIATPVSSAGSSSVLPAKAE